MGEAPFPEHQSLEGLAGIRTGVGAWQRAVYRLSRWGVEAPSGPAEREPLRKMGGRHASREEVEGRLKEDLWAAASQTPSPVVQVSFQVVHPEQAGGEQKTHRVRVV